MNPQKARRGVERSVLLGAMLLALSGVLSACVLFEDPSAIEGVDVTQVDQIDQVEVEELEELDTIDDSDVDGEECAGDAATACGSSCFDCTTLPGVDAVRCEAGACVIDACAAARLDCDGEVSNGCEEEEGPAHCGASCQSCEGHPNTSAGSCVAGACVLQCVSNYLDCDGELDTGCETAQSMSVCGAACLDCAALPNVAAASCGAEGCEIDACEWGYSDCNGEPADGCERAFDPTACGPSCTTNCTTLAGVDEVACVAGSCAVLSCAPGYSDVDEQGSNGCEHQCALGECWDPLSVPLRVLSFIDASWGVAGLSDGRVALTKDGGLHWYPRLTPLTSAIAAVANNGEGVVLAIGTDGTVILSHDMGLSWTRVLLPVGTGTPVAAAADGLLLVLVGNGVYVRSIDGGQTWENRSADVAGANLTAAYVHEEVVMLGGADGRVLLSVEAGLDLLAATAPSSNSIRFFVPWGSRVLAGGPNFISTTSDDGRSWTPLEGLELQRNWTGFSATAERMLIHSPNELVYRPAPDADFVLSSVPGALPIIGAHFVGNEANLFSVEEPLGVVFQTEWVPATTEEEVDELLLHRLDSALVENGLRWIYEDGNTLYVGGMDSGQLMHSADDGMNWTLEDLGARHPLLIEGMQSGSAGFVAAPMEQAFFLSAGTWISTIDDPAYAFRALHYVPESSLALGIGEYNMLPSVFAGVEADGGFMWAPLPCNQPGFCQMALPATLTAMAVQHSSGLTRAMIGSAQGEILRSADGGATWNTCFAPAGSSRGIAGLMYRGFNVAFYTVGAIGVGSEIYFSASDGDNWPGVTGPVAAWSGDGETKLRLYDWAWSGRTGVAVGDHGTMIISLNSGREWLPIETGVDRPLRHVVVYDPDGATNNDGNETIIAMADDGTVVYTSDGGANVGVSAVELRGLLPSELSLDGDRVLMVGERGQIRASQRP